MVEGAQDDEPPSVAFTIRLQPEIIEIIEKDVAGAKYWGKRRATICANLILDILKRLDAEGTIKPRKD
jgi:hypothetical protein